jgi:hypothetical protein
MDKVRNKRAILERIAAHVGSQDNLTYGDTPYYNDNSGSGFFPEYVLESQPVEADEKEGDPK